MFFSTEYVTGGDTGFALIDNGLAGMLGEDVAYGMGGVETGFNGVLFFGIFISTMLILFEGAKGKWTIMLPVIRYVYNDRLYLDELEPRERSERDSKVRFNFSDAGLHRRLRTLA